MSIDAEARVFAGAYTAAYGGRVSGVCREAYAEDVATRALAAFRRAVAAPHVVAVAVVALDGRTSERIYATAAEAEAARASWAEAEPDAAPRVVGLVEVARRP